MSLSDSEMRPCSLRSAPREKSWTMRRPNADQSGGGALSQGQGVRLPPSPTGFPKTRSARWRMVHDVLLRGCWPARSRRTLRTIMAIKSQGVRQTTYEEYIGSLPIPRHHKHLHTLEPLKGPHSRTESGADLCSLRSAFPRRPRFDARRFVRELVGHRAERGGKDHRPALDNLQLAWRNVRGPFVAKARPPRIQPDVHARSRRAMRPWPSSHLKCVKEATGNSTICLP